MTITTNGAVTGLISASEAAWLTSSVSGASKRASFVVRPCPGPVSATAGPLTDTQLLVASSPVKYNAVRIGYIHAGGSGAVAGLIGVCAATDDVGTQDFTTLTDANFKKVTTPKRGGTTTNALGAAGADGWRTLTWATASSVGIADPGAGKQSITWTDLIQCEGIIDSAGVYPLLVRMYPGSAAASRIGILTGMQTGANYVTDVQKSYALSILRTGDNVTTLANWADANTPSTGSPLALLVQFYAAGDVTDMVVVGDSRFGVSTELNASKAYYSFEAYLNNAFVAASRAVTLFRGGISGGSSAVYQLAAMNLLNTGYAPDVLLYLVWSVNDGSPTTALTAVAKFRAAEIVDKAKQAGAKVILIPYFPKGGGFTAPELAALADVKTFCTSTGATVFDAAATYGTSTGDWNSGVSFDGTNHMTQASYSDMATRVAALA